MHTSYPITLATAAFFAAVSFAGAQQLSSAQINIIVNDLAESATHSWELGTRTQALLELDTPSFSVLTPRQPIPPSPYAPSSLDTVLSIATTTVANRSISNGATITGPQPLINGDGAAGDPCSLGVSVLIANWTEQQKKTGLDYAGAASDQLEYLLWDVPRTAEGAISQRVDQVQLWSDFTYMVPPFLAYYGAITSNKSLMIDGYTQISLYRDQLRTPLSLPSSPHASLWQHIVLGTGSLDPGHWSTGNGWACGGMLRVLGTFANSRFAEDSDIKEMISDLSNWVDEILDGLYYYQQSSGLFLNYADQALGSSSTVFPDTSSTAIVTSCAFRHSILNNIHTHIPQAEFARKALSSSKTNATSNNFVGATHFTQGGFVVPVVNPEDWSEQLNLTTSSPAADVGSPESEGFLVEMQAAWQDWVAAGSKGA